MDQQTESTMALRTSAQMRDSELRGIVLRRFYDRRREGQYIKLKDEDFRAVPEELELQDVFRACEQLGEHGLIDWKSADRIDGVLDGFGKISAYGVDVVEGTATATLSLTVDNRSYAFNQSHHNIVGDSNVQVSDITLGRLADMISAANASEAEKTEARGVLARAFEHPAVAAILTGVAEGITRAFKD
jgi:hypothetical protein